MSLLWAEPDRDSRGKILKRPHDWEAMTPPHGRCLRCGHKWYRYYTYRDGGCVPRDDILPVKIGDLVYRYGHNRDGDDEVSVSVVNGIGLASHGSGGSRWEATTNRLFAGPPLGDGESESRYKGRQRLLTPDETRDLIHRLVETRRAASAREISDEYNEALDVLDGLPGSLFNDNEEDGEGE